MTFERENEQFGLRDNELADNDFTVVSQAEMEDTSDVNADGEFVNEASMSQDVGSLAITGYEADEPLDGNWQEYSNCLGVDPDIFFPERGAPTREAKEVCSGCVVREDCLEYALGNSERFGIWGGMSERQRRRVRRQRKVAQNEQRS